MKRINDIYKISKSGQVYKKRPKEKTFKKVKQSNINGYKVCSINSKNKYIHRLMWETYVGVIPEGFEIDHINDKRNDNHINNLRCITKAENARKAMKRSFNRGVINGSHKKIKIKAFWKEEDKKKQKTFDSSKSASEYFNISAQTMNDNLKGRSKLVLKKYRFKYA